MCDQNKGSRSLIEFPHRNPEFFRLVGEIGGYAGTGEDDDADGQAVQHLVIAFERRRFGMAGPVRPEGDLWRLAQPSFQLGYLAGGSFSV